MKIFENIQKVALPDWLPARLAAYTFWKVAVSVVADAFAAAVALLLFLVTVIITTTTTALCFLLIPPLLPLLSCPQLQHHKVCRSWEVDAHHFCSGSRRTILQPIVIIVEIVHLLVKLSFCMFETAHFGALAGRDSIFIDFQLNSY